jgi:hypothetical protein
MQNSCIQKKIKILPKLYHFVARILLGSPSRIRDIILTKCPNRICCCIQLQSSQENKFLTYTLVRPKLGEGEMRGKRGKLVITVHTYNLDPKRVQVQGSRLREHGTGWTYLYTFALFLGAQSQSITTANLMTSLGTTLFQFYYSE